MTLTQLKTYIVGVLKGWFQNKAVLDKFSESESGELLYNGKPIGGGSSSTPVTNEQVSQAVTDTLESLNASEPEEPGTEEGAEENPDVEETGEEDQ